MENTNTQMQVAKPAATLSIASSDDTLHLAQDLSKFIKEKKLCTPIQGKDFVQVEGWQYAGMRLGLVAVPQEIVNISTDDEIKYKASVDIINVMTGAKVGAGFAICSNKEQGKKYYQEFAIASMAQTRAVGKGFRNLLSWIIKAAGYEPTPSEEMDYQGNTEPAVPTEKPVKQKAEKEQHKQETDAGVKYASAKQQEEIIRLLNSPQVTKQEKTKMLLNLNKLDEVRAEQAITKLKATIQERENAA